MTIYLLEIIIIFISSLFFRRVKDSQKVYCYFVMVTLLLLMGLRSEKLGMNDVEYVYMPMFYRIQHISFSEIGEIYPFVRGNLLQMLTKIFTIYCNNKYIWLFCTSIPFVVAITHMIRKYAVNRYVCALCFFMIIGLRIFTSNFYLIRHSIALAILIFAFDSVVKKNLSKFIILVILATLFHTTALTFLVAYPFARVKLSIKHLVLIVGGFYFVTYQASNVMNLLFSWLSTDNYYLNYAKKTGFSSYTFVILCLLMFITAFIIARRNGINEQNAMMTNMLCISVVVMGMSTVISEFYRISFFFLSIGSVGYCNVINSEKKKNIRYTIYIFTFVLFLSFFINALEPENLVPYKSWLFS